MFFKRKVYDKLKEWKDKYNGKYAALIEGPRRVGKSTVAEEFAKREYRSYIKIDFSNIDDETLSIFGDISNPDMFFLRLSAKKETELYRRESVIIFDEIQLQPKVRQAIKHLVADGRYDYIENGSLLSIRKNVQNIVIPSEEHKIRMYPMDWEEFLWATKGENSCYSTLRSFYENRLPLGQAVNRAKMKDYRLFMAVGGMPQAVEAYIEKSSFMEIDRVKRKIIELYEEDFFKIDPSGRISKIFESIPSQLARGGMNFSLSEATGKTESIKDRKLFYDLITSCTVLPCWNCTDPSFTLSQGVDLFRFKLYTADNGLLVTLLLKTGAAVFSELYTKMLSDTLPANLGYLYENAAAVTIASSGKDLYYTTWKKDNSTHKFKLDFLIAKGTKIMPVECKSSKTTNHASLDEFMRKYPSRVISPAVFSQKDYSKDGHISLYPYCLMPFVIGEEDRE